MAATVAAETAHTFRGAAFKPCNPFFTSGDFQLFWRHCSPGHESRAMRAPAHAAMAMPAKQGREFYCELHGSTKAASRYQFISHVLHPFGNADKRHETKGGVQKSYLTKNVLLFYILLIFQPASREMRPDHCLGERRLVKRSNKNPEMRLAECWHTQCSPL